MFVDIQTVQSARHADRGIPRFATELSRALLASGAPLAGLALNPLRPFPRRLHPHLARAPQLVWNTASAFRRAASDGPLCSVVTSAFEDDRPAESVLAPHVRGVPRVVVVYDLIPEVLGYLPRDEDVLPYKARRAWVQDSDMLVTISEHTRLDVIEHWGVEPSRVSVIGAAPAAFFAPTPAGDDPRARVRRALPAVTRPFVLSVSAWLWHKNLETLIDAWALVPRALRGEHQLVLAGTISGDGHKHLLKRAESRGLAPGDVVLTGFVPDGLLRDLYCSTSLFVLPSRYEGYGLPVAEAIACGAPAITSDSSSLPEIVGWAAGTFPPDNTDAIAALLERALTDREYRTQLAAACRASAGQHAWPDVARRLVDVCAGLAHRPYVPGPTRLALVGAFPPRSSPRAVANRQLAGHLARSCDVDCFVEHDPTVSERPRVPGASRTFPARSLGTVISPASYDAVVYAIGTGYESVETRRAAAHYPGVVVGDDPAAAALVPNALATIVERDAERAASALLELSFAELAPRRPREAPAALAMAS